ncbi:MAG: ankyrin repeat domain-containing protein [Akkermansiaceae bacterium]|nr:ankyrin repeat domain-containing protein [Akkermansiaceae bacterium]
MKIRSPHNLTNFFFFTGIILQSSLAQQTPDLASQIEGEWIIYRGDNFEIKKISNQKTQSNFYRWNGTLRSKKDSHLKLTSLGKGKAEFIIPKGAQWQYLDGGKRPESSRWTNLSFDSKASGWKTGKAGFGYADNDDETIITDMENKYLSIFIRREFELPKEAELKGLGLLINYDDGFILYANGRRLFESSNVNVEKKTGEITVNNHEANGSEFFSLGEYASAFREGKNVIAIQGINTNLESSDFTLDPQILMGGTGSFIESSHQITHVDSSSNGYDKDRTWKGKVDNLQIWERALSENEVLGLWNNGKGNNKVSKELVEGLIGHWPFDGNLKDASGNKRHATGKNSPGFAKGQFGQALDLNGTNQYVLLGGQPTDYTPKNGNITLSMWFSADAFDKRWQTLVSMGDSWTDWRVHRFGTTDTMAYAAGRWVRNTRDVLDGKMHHLVAISEKGKGVRLFVDNFLVTSNASSKQAQNFLGIIPDEDGWLPAVGANLQGQINLSKSIEGEFIPMQDSLRISTSSGRNNDSGFYRKVTHPEEALLIAARNGNIDTVKTLLDSGVDADVTSPNSYTALGYAGIGGHLELMQLLIKHGADVNKQSRFMKSPLSVVAGSPQIAAIKLLIASGAKFKTNYNGGSIAHEAVFWEQPEMLEFILEDLKVSPNLQGKNGATPLHYAIHKMERGQNTANQKHLEALKILLKNGVNSDLRFKDNNGNNQTALEQAMSKGLDDVVAILKNSR